MKYKKFVKKCKSILPNLPDDLLTSNYDLEALAKAFGIENFTVYIEPSCGGRKIQDGEICIINASNHPGETGHWVAAAYVNNTKYYYDSFGCLPPPGVKSFINGEYLGGDCKTQDIKDNCCGIKALYVCYGLSQGIELNDILYEMEE